MCYSSSFIKTRLNQLDCISSLEKELQISILYIPNFSFSKILLSELFCNLEVLVETLGQICTGHNFYIVVDFM